MGFAQWATFGLDRGLILGPIWANPLESKWDNNGLDMGFHVGTRWAPSGLSPVKILLFKFSVFENGLQMGPRWVLPSGLDKGLGEGLNWGPFGLAHLKLSGVRMGWIWVSRWVQYGPKVGPAQEKYFD